MTVSKLLKSCARPPAGRPLPSSAHGAMLPRLVRGRQFLFVALGWRRPPLARETATFPPNTPRKRTARPAGFPRSGRPAAGEIARGPVFQPSARPALARLAAAPRYPLLGPRPPPESCWGRCGCRSSRGLRTASPSHLEPHLLILHKVVPYSVKRQL